MPNTFREGKDEDSQPKSGASSLFRALVDELVEFSECDPELADGLKWLDKEAQRRGIDFYEMAFIVLHRYDTEERAKNWLARR